MKRKTDFLGNRAFKPDSEHISIIFIFLILFSVYGFVIIDKKSLAVSGCDSYAYLQGASLMAKKGFCNTMIHDPIVPLVYSNFQPKPERENIQFLLSPHGHYVYDFERGTIYNVFPPGLPVFLSPFIRMAGRSAAFYVIPCLNLIFFILFFYFGSKYVNMYFGLCLASFTFINYPIFSNTITIMSDVPSVITLSLSIFLLYLGLIKSRKYFSFLAGMIFGFSILIRYSNLVGALPVFLVFLFHDIEKKMKFRIALEHLVFFSLSTFVFGFIPLMFYSHHLFGTLFRLTYEPITQSKMNFSYFPSGALFYLKSILDIFGLTGVILIILGIIVSLSSHRKFFMGIVCIVGFLSFFLFYSFHSIRHDRYLAPTFPFLATLAGFAVVGILKKLDRQKLLKIFLILILASYPLVRSLPSYHQGYVNEEKMSVAIKNRVEKNSVVLCDQMSGPLRLYAEISTLRFKWASRSILMETISILKENGFTIYFLLDSEAAKSHFDLLIEKGFIRKSDLLRYNDINEIPFYKLL